MTRHPLHLRLPDSLNAENSLHFIRSIPTSTNYTELTVDFSQIKRAFPFGTLIIATAIKQLISRINKSRNENINLQYTGIEHLDEIYGYLAHIGFFKYIGFDIGRAPGEAKGGHSYVPIKCITEEDVKFNKGKDEYRRSIVAVSEELSNVIASTFHPEKDTYDDTFIFKISSYCIREIIRNVFEHSGAKSLYVAAQSFRTIGSAEVVIIDEGMGIAESLRSSGENVPCLEALQSAILPGISSKLDLNPDNFMGNSGFGLFTTSKLCTFFNDSQFTLCSSGSALALHHIDKKNVFADLNLSGTAVMLKLSSNEEYYFENLLSSIITEGELLAQTKNPQAKASKFSKILK